jgi:hypothetical protein
MRALTLFRPLVFVVAALPPRAGRAQQAGFTLEQALAAPRSGSESVDHRHAHTAEGTHPRAASIGRHRVGDLHESDGPANAS